MATMSFGTTFLFHFSARVYEEEDLQPGLYSLNLCNELSDQKVIASLKDCENDIQKKMREVDAASDKFEDLTAVLNRIKFERLLLQSLILLYPSKSFSPNETEMGEISKLLTSAAELMSPIKNTLDRGTQPESEFTQLRSLFSFLLSFAFYFRWYAKCYGIFTHGESTFTATNLSSIYENQGP